MPLLNTPYEGRETDTGIEALPLFDAHLVYLSLKGERKVTE